MIRPHWTLLEASKLAHRLEFCISRQGFLLSIYGSVLRHGEGRDLDMILAPKRCGASPELVIMAICDELDAKLLHTEKSLFCELVALIELPDNRLLDVQVRMSAIRDALDLYESNFANYTASIAAEQEDVP